VPSSWPLEGAMAASVSEDLRGQFTEVLGLVKSDAIFLHRMGRETNQGEIAFEFDGRFYRIRNFDAGPARE
jgi:hypothetical protein